MDSTERRDNAREFREIATLMQQAVSPVPPVIAEDEPLQPGDRCDGCKQNVASDGACWCDEEDED